MRNAFLTLAACAIMACASGCAGNFTAPVKPPVAFVFTNVRAPMSIDFNPQTAVARKSGQTSVHCILGLFSWGDGSAVAAAANGRLTTINYLDYEFLNVLGVYSRFTTFAHGN